MRTILTLPDGSAIDARFVGAITWDKERTGSYPSPACIRVHAIKESFSLSAGPKIEQMHYLPMESDEAAKTACEALVRGWTGNIFKPETETP